MLPNKLPLATVLFPNKVPPDGFAAADELPNKPPPVVVGAFLPKRLGPAPNKLPFGAVVFSFCFASPDPDAAFPKGANKLKPLLFSYGANRLDDYLTSASLLVLSTTRRLIFTIFRYAI